MPRLLAKRKAWLVARDAQPHAIVELARKIQARLVAPPPEDCACSLAEHFNKCSARLHQFYFSSKPDRCRSD
ncbi:hypothetical protein EVAR_21952_1 [Eumeta japonica]|uniref:Uncharacterized protein n=1 Tax=Eumeta variegata TaxID=151549 RepID=A0A4C1VXW9_EUMVA|nr:hypothetical protein EVAR_21952_1 [Eumeta japonica]